MTRTFNKMFFILALLTSLLWAGSMQAQPSRYVEGVHYQTLEQANHGSENLNQVMEVFWYGCGHCYAFEPLLENWQQANANSVDFVRSPVMWNETAAQHAQLYFATEALGITNEVHGEIFGAIHQQGKYLLSQSNARDFLVSLGVDGTEFDNAYQSFSVDTNVRQASELQKQIGISSVPSMVVNGKYLVFVNNEVQSHEEILNIVNFLLAKDQS